MKDRNGRARVGIALVISIAAMLAVGLAPAALANNLDRKTAQDVARDVARKDCRNTAGCTDYRAVNLHRVSKHKAVGKIEVESVKNGQRFECTRQLVIKLDHSTGKIYYAVSRRRCDELGPA